MYSWVKQVLSVIAAIFQDYLIIIMFGNMKHILQIICTETFQEPFPSYRRVSRLAYLNRKKT